MNTVVLKTIKDDRPDGELIVGVAVIDRPDEWHTARVGPGDPYWQRKELMKQITAIQAPFWDRLKDWGKS